MCPSRLVRHLQLCVDGLRYASTSGKLAGKRGNLPDLMGRTFGVLTKHRDLLSRVLDRRLEAMATFWGRVGYAAEHGTDGLTAGYIMELVDFLQDAGECLERRR